MHPFSEKAAVFKSVYFVYINSQLSTLSFALQREEKREMSHIKCFLLKIRHYPPPCSLSSSMTEETASGLLAFSKLLIHSSLKALEAL